MNRRGFFGRLASVAAAVTVAPTVAKAAEAVLIPGVPGTRIVIPYRKLAATVTFSGPELVRGRSMDFCLAEIYAPAVAKMINAPSPFLAAFQADRERGDA